MNDNDNLVYDCHFYSHDLQKYSEVKMNFLPRVGDVIQNSGYISKVDLIEYGFGLQSYNIYTTKLGETSNYEKIISSILEAHRT